MTSQPIHPPRLTVKPAASIAIFIAACVAGAGTAPVHAGDEVAIKSFSSAAPGEPPAVWKFATLPNKVATRFSIIDLAGTRVLKVEADESYGNLVHAVRAKAGEHAALAWRWRVDKLVENADIKTRAGDDAAAKMCVFFAFDAAKLPFGERARLTLANSATGEVVPTQTLCYVWDNKLPIDTGLINAFTKRIRFIVLQSGTGKLGQWVAERRDLSVDYQRMFSDESEGKIPEIVGVAVSADADNTHGHGLAFFGDVSLVP